MSLRRECWTLGALGAAVAVLGGTLPISMKVARLSSAEAWDVGLAPVLVVSGATLSLLAWLLYRGHRWARWPIALWFPLYFAAFALTAATRGFLLTDLEWLEALITAGIWLFGIWWISRGA